MRVLQISFFQAEIVPILIFFALFFLVICGGIQIGNRIKVKPNEDKPSMFSEIFAEEQTEDTEARAAWNGTADAQAGTVRSEAADWSDMTPAEQNGSADWNGAAGSGECD
ncbi:MAG: hypothetical protein ACI3XY_09395 [Butyricicoccaceae bacterium]